MSDGRAKVTRQVTPGPGMMRASCSGEPAATDGSPAQATASQAQAGTGTPWEWDRATIQALLDAGADLNAKDDDGNTPLHNAARFNDNPAVIQVLLDAGADPNVKNDGGLTPLDVAEEVINSAAISILRDLRE